MKPFHLLILTATLSLTACAIPRQPPMPNGAERPVNSLSTAEMLAHEAGYVLVGPRRNDREVKAHFLYNGRIFAQKPQELQRQLSRQPQREDYAQVPGAELIKRTVVVPFPFGSAEFRPTPQQRLQLRQLLAVADRVELRGRTDGRGNPAADERMAHLRAEAAKRYLLDRGVPARIIAINYQAAGDYIADNERPGGRNINRRVELEFYIDDFTQPRAPMINDGFVAVESNKCIKPDVSEWQTVSSTTSRPMDCIN